MNTKKQASQTTLKCSNFLIKFSCFLYEKTYLQITKKTVNDVNTWHKKSAMQPLRVTSETPKKFV